jgi:hypothetical protein
MVVLSNALEGKDDVYNDWYDNVHAGDVLTRLRGYTGVTRYTVAERQLASPVVWSYLALWDVDATLGLAEAVESIRELRVIKKSGDFDPSDTLYRANPAINGATSTWFRQIERVDGNRGPDADDDHLLTVFSNNQPGRDDEFQEWYAQHCRDVVFKLSAFKSAERYIAFDDQGSPIQQRACRLRLETSERTGSRWAPATSKFHDATSAVGRGYCASPSQHSAARARRNSVLGWRQPAPEPPALTEQTS